MIYKQMASYIVIYTTIMHNYNDNIDLFTVVSQYHSDTAVLLLAIVYLYEYNVKTIIWLLSGSQL